MGDRQSWLAVVLKALEELKADERAVSLRELYEAVKSVAPARCDDSSVYAFRGRGEPRWKRDVRDALAKLKRRGIVVREGRGVWRLAKTS